jgi:hypothetical protein
MRSTLTLDEDVAVKLQDEMHTSGRSFKETVNSLLRLGLAARRELEQRPPFQVKARPLGVHSGLDYDNIGELLEQIEGPISR